MIRRTAKCIRREETNRTGNGIRGLQICSLASLFGGMYPFAMQEAQSPPRLSLPFALRIDRPFFLFSFSPFFSVTTTNSSPLLRGSISSSSVASPRKSGTQNADTNVSLVTSTARCSFSDSTRDGWLHSSVRLHSAAYAPHFVSTRRTRTHGFHGSTHGRIKAFRQVQETKSAVSFHSVPFFLKEKQDEGNRASTGWTMRQPDRCEGRSITLEKCLLKSLYIFKCMKRIFIKHIGILGCIF